MITPPSRLSPAKSPRLWLSENMMTHIGNHVGLESGTILGYLGRIYIDAGRAQKMEHGKWETEKSQREEHGPNGKEKSKARHARPLCSILSLYSQLAQVLGSTVEWGIYG